MDIQFPFSLWSTAFKAFLRLTSDAVLTEDAPYVNGRSRCPYFMAVTVCSHTVQFYYSVKCTYSFYYRYADFLIPTGDAQSRSGKSLTYHGFQKIAGLETDHHQL
jgi:hypothetical protein